MARRDTNFPKHVQRQIEDRADGSCERCGMSAPAYQLHHRRPRGAGGSRAADTNRASNGLYVCVSCHTDIEKHREDALKFGWLVRQGQSPVDVKVLRRGTWVLLADDGRMH